MPTDLETARHTMIEQQVRPWEVLDPRVLEVLGKIHREDFVPPRFRRLAFTDFEVPLAHGEMMMKPIIEGRMLQALQLAPDNEVLEIGTGSGFITACLCELVRSVLSIDIHADFVESAAARMQDVTCARIEVADALTFEPGRQFDAVAVTAAVTEIPQRFRDWVRPGGRLFVIRGHSPNMEAMLLTRDLDGSGWSEESLFETDVPYLRGAAPQPRFVL
jgi:protein-L-isoaspartate(D-aspartate) O-methyltransferase